MDASIPASPGTRPRDVDRALPTGLPLGLVRFVVSLCVAASLLLLSYKVWLAWRLNINWDEFYFLNHVHALARGDLGLLLQGAYTHAFLWVTGIPGYEADQVVAGRLAMIALLALTALLVWKLARRWTTNLGAVIAALCYLCFMSVISHGGSFRADSLLAPLTVAALVLLTAPSMRFSAALAGACLGVAFVVSVKTVLIGPVVLALCLLCPGAGNRSRRLLILGIAAAVVATALLGLHWFSLDHGAAVTPQEFAARTARKTLVDVPWFPRWRDLHYLVRSQQLPWVLMAFGFLIAALRKRFDLAALALTLVPIAFYRNAFTYYYVVMLAPAAVLAGYAVEEAGRFAAERAKPLASGALVIVIVLGVLQQGADYAYRLRHDDQVEQRAVIAGIHQIFPDPVSYIDRCGMISSFPKSNFFMSTWGLESYRARGEPFMPAVLAHSRPAFLLANTAALDADTAGSTNLLPEDRELVRRHFLPYWGPVRVAGTSFEATSSGSAIEFPFAGRFRLDATQPVNANGRTLQPGEVLEVAADSLRVHVATRGPVSTGVPARFVIATAQPAPPTTPPAVALFTGL